jgi:hypothetical protein
MANGMANGNTIKNSILISFASRGKFRDLQIMPENFKLVNLVCKERREVGKSRLGCIY